MGRRTGTADLPLHGGRVPAWLSTRMAALGRVVCEAIVHHYGRDELLRRLSHPFWFQAFGTVMGMDWHSSGITTSVVGALKRGLRPVADELGVYVCGGRGKASRRTPDELHQLGEAHSLDAAGLAQTSRLVAKIDSAAVQDGFEVYLHSFVVAADGAWCVIQQGMSDARGTARRYHWLSESVGSFLDDPHAAIEGRPQGAIVNLADVRAATNRNAQLELFDLEGSSGMLREMQRIHDSLDAGPNLRLALDAPHLVMPAHHDVRAEDILPRRLAGVLAAVDERGPKDFTDLLMTPGVGARTVRALALTAEIIHGAPSRFTDPARYSIAHGGKDGHPFPVPLAVYDETISVLKSAVRSAQLGQEDRLSAIRALDVHARRLEAEAARPHIESLFAEERAESHRLKGRTAAGWAQPPSKADRVAKG